MGALTEVEIFDRMSTSLRLSAEACDELAVNPVKGLAYARLVDELKLIEGCCKQASAWRSDTRWLNLVFVVAGVHKHAGECLRGVPVQNGPRIKFNAKHSNAFFIKLAENLRALKISADAIRDQRTGRAGMILPEMGRAPTRTEGRQVQVMLPPGMQARPSGLIVPTGAAA